MCSPISSRFSAHMEKLPRVRLPADKLLNTIRPRILTTITASDIQMVCAGMTPLSAAASSPVSTVRMAMMGSIWNTESNKVNTKESSREPRSLPEKSNSRFISLIIVHPPLPYLWR